VTDNERFTNYQQSGITYKDNNWNNSSADFKLTHSYTPHTGTNEDDAVFVPLAVATLSNSLDGTVITGTNGGYIPFVDPWYVDASDNQTGQPVQITSGNSPTGAYGQSSGGVFLGQNIHFDPTLPIYSVQAPTSQTISNHTAFFGGWSASPSGYVTFQNVTSPTTAVVFNSAGAAVTANYIYSVVASNATLQAGTYTFVGSLTINSGATLTLNSGTTLNFPSGAGLVVNGALSASGTTFNFVQSPSYPYLTGITINSNGSSLTNCTISGADQPLVFTNVNTATISGCTINNSIFSSSQAISVSNSTPTITTVHINGLTGTNNSSNGVRYTNGRGGTISGSVIQNCGAGNGIVIQGNSNPTITDNTIQGNHYHGIIVTGNGTGTPNINGNDLESNGIVNGTKTYCGMVFDGSTGYVQLNTIRYSNYGIYCENSGSPQAYISMGDIGDNIITNNLYGIDAYNHSFPQFGYGNAQLGRYYAVCNEIHDNTSYDAAVQSNSGLDAMYNWWGQYPVNMAKHYHDATSTEKVRFKRGYGTCCRIKYSKQQGIFRFSESFNK